VANETAITIDTSSIKFGRGVTREAGYEMKRLGARKVMVVTDPALSKSLPVSTVLKSLDDDGIDPAGADTGPALARPEKPSGDP
jgi:hydroxyacid-oxoacid transhydrogenase